MSPIPKPRAVPPQGYSAQISKQAVLHLKEGQRLEVPGGFIESMHVTPEFAAELLANRHPDQRHVRHRHVENLAKAMTDGEWHSTLVPLLMDEDLRLIDGQHRLQAVVKSGRAQNFLIAILSDPKAFYAIDQNAPRSVNDIRSTLGKEPVRGTIRGAILLEKRGFAETREVLSKQQQDQIFDEFPLMEEIKELEKIGSKLKIMNVGSLAAAIAALRVNKGEAMKFFTAVFQMTSVIDGEEVPQAHLLYMFLHMVREKGGGRTTGEHFLREAAYKSIRAWNAWRKDEMITKLQYEPSAKFPKVSR